MGKKRRRTDENTEFDLTRKAKEVKDDNEKRLIVILENAQLETVKVTKSLIILSLHTRIVIPIVTPIIRYTGGQSF